MTISPLAKKVFVKPGHRIAIVNAPAGYVDLIQPLPEGAELVGDQSGDLDLVMVYAADSAEADRLAPAALGRLKPNGLLWVCYRKGGKKAGTDLNRDILWAQLKRFGLEGVAQVAVDDAWSAMRFRPAELVRK